MNDKKKIENSKILPFAHVHLYIKNWYKVNMTKREALARIIGKTILLPEKYVDVESIILKQAIHYILKNEYTCEQNLIELIVSTNSKSNYYKMFKIKDFNEAILLESISQLSVLDIDKLDGSLPDPTPLKFFSEDELLESEEETLIKWNKLKH